jgi:hypothetical protein
MRSTKVGKILIGITAGLFVGAAQMDCVSDLPPISLPGGSGGNGGVAGNGGNGGNGGAAANGGNGAAGQTSLIGTMPSGGSNADANVQDVEPVVASADANCGVQTQNPKAKQVDLLLVLDRSGSMAYDIASGSNCNVGSTTCTQRWATVTASLQQVLAATPASVQWGLKLFTSPKGSTCTVNAGADVPVGPNSAAQIQTTMTSTSPANQTPTKDAVNAAVAYYKTLNDGLAHYILLATDGQPNCDPGTSGSTTTTAVNNTIAAITAAAAPGSDIKTYVIGIGPEAGNLTAFALAGGTTDFFPASSPDALTQALTTIVGTVASCDFTMAEAPPDPANLGVYLDSTTRVPRDPSEGFSLAADNVTVTLHGSYCDKIKDGTFKVVQVFFGCPGVPLPDNF